MPAISINKSTVSDHSGDLDLARRALTRDADAFRTIMQTHNLRLYRIARGVVRNDGEAEDVVQEAYLNAFAHLDTFRGDASLATWLSRIVINEARGRLRRQQRASVVAATFVRDAQIIQFPLSKNDNPEQAMAQRQILQLIERAIDKLPNLYRIVFVARVIEGLSIEETANLLAIRPETVKTRLHRARHLVRQQLDAQIGPVLLDAFPFAGRRCERLTATIMERIGFPEQPVA
ncbi:RNA polymerase sigma factor [Phyllobacterium bourgognense]|uniref:RNA polymerase sigma factor n=1 Tax=Phyllobacterium bourgognense TaxID=314236 RepID=A0A368YED3_9HYPH|nr:RNA polymerase sigma factor [Phyllobacterium bourgognense]RCW78590.1 RNA polymerase sigma-70 factor (ECF subfamily) [Phyllobacterium bourgognense]